jgi:hypothetical protein
MIKPYIREFKELPGDPIGGASGAKRYFHVEFLGKPDSPDFPFTVANEVVATELGRALGLNVPSVITHSVDGDTLVLIQMLDRDSRLQQGPPATAKALKESVEADPRAIHGAIVFDLYVANNDRAVGPERRNLALGPEGRLQLFDHGNACFYRPRPTAGVECGITRLTSVEADMKNLFDMDHKKNHFREYLTDWALVEEWCARIRQLPDFLVEGIVSRIPADLSRPTVEERRELARFLLKRRTYLFDQIADNPALFPGLPPRGRSRS